MRKIGIARYQNDDIGAHLYGIDCHQYVEGWILRNPGEIWYR
jgi:hypothetical protein